MVHMDTEKLAAAISTAFGNKLRGVRAERNLTREELGKLSGMSVKTIQRFENGERSPNLDQFYSLCTALGVDAGELVSSAFRGITDPGK